MINKNDVFTVEITDQDDLGQGIGKADGFPLFVKHAVTGDVVKAAVTKAKKTYAFARIAEFVKKSDDRVESVCPVYKRCGGCQLQNMTYPAQLRFKQKRVQECIRRIGGFDDIQTEEILGSELQFRYRNKAQYPVGRDKDGKITCGFFAERTHDIIACDDCLLSPKEFSEITALVIEWMNENHIEPYNETTGRGLVRHIFLRKGFSTGDIGLCLIINGNKLPAFEALRNKLAEFSDIRSISVSINKKRSNVIMGDKLITLSGTRYIEDSIGDVRFRISPMSFYQINPPQTKRLYDKVIEFCGFTGNETVIDLYCGIGTISLYMARHAKKVYGIEIVPQAIEDANENAKLNSIENAEFYAGKAEEVLPRLYKNGLKRADIVVVDPPRKGCDEVALSTIADIAPEKLVYVSCNPATLARDMKILKEKGYYPKKVHPVDMFPNSVHTETVCLLSNRKPDTKVRVDVDLEDYYRIKDAEKNQN